MNKNRENEDAELDFWTKREKESQLILFNDDHHDFEYVITTLVDVCKHTPLQAEQCTYIAHYTGRCDVKRGKYTELKGMRDELIEKGFEAELN